ncbi:B3/B4 tRNA-binding domain-containing protein [Tanacetum coccineum]|uniref:B3/B4 tRNA-binding domain-containing protein n=1 Tax=Tanacetum coccineum TaxID=301880 RepID=A0ABQ5FAR0_9ASTR
MVMRSSLIDGVLKTVAHNQDHSNPIKGTNVYVDNIDVDVTEDLLRENFNHFVSSQFKSAPSRPAFLEQSFANAHDETLVKDDDDDEDDDDDIEEY